MDAKIVRMRELYKMAGPRSSVEPFNHDETNEQSGKNKFWLLNLKGDCFIYLFKPGWWNTNLMLYGLNNKKKKKTKENTIPKIR